MTHRPNTIRPSFRLQYNRTNHTEVGDEGILGCPCAFCAFYVFDLIEAVSLLEGSRERASALTRYLLFPSRPYYSPGGLNVQAGTQREIYRKGLSERPEGRSILAFFQLCTGHFSKRDVIWVVPWRKQNEFTTILYTKTTGFRQ